MSKDSSVKYYQETKEKLLKRNIVKDIKIFLKKEKNKKQEYGRKLYKNFLEHKEERLGEYRKKIL